MPNKSRKSADNSRKNQEELLNAAFSLLKSCDVPKTVENIINILLATQCEWSSKLIIRLGEAEAKKGKYANIFIQAQLKAHGSN